MGLRETLQRRPGIAVGAAVLLIMCSAGMAFWQFRSITSTGTSGDAFYTADDGNTYFVGPASAVSPIKVNGQDAYRCYVFRCGADKPFVGYMAKYTEGSIRTGPYVVPPPSATPPREGPSTANPASTGPGGAAMMQRPPSIACKKPGDRNWVTSAEMLLIAQITRPRCSNGTGAEPVMPR